MVMFQFSLLNVKVSRYEIKSSFHITFEGVFEISSYILCPCPSFLPEKGKGTSFGKVKGKAKISRNKF